MGLVNLGDTSLFLFLPCMSNLLCHVMPGDVFFGRRDIIGDKTVASIKTELSGGDAPVEVKRFDDSGHLPHLDEREEYVMVRETVHHGGSM